MTSTIQTPSTKTAPAEVQLDEGQDQNTYQENRTMKNVTPSLAQTNDTPPAGREWTEIICARIDAERRSRGMSKADFARRANTPPTTAQRLLAGRGRLTLDTMTRAASAVGVSLELLMREATEEVNR